LHSQVLKQENIKDKLDVSIEIRQRAMKSFASLSKSLDIYDKLKEIKKDIN